MDRVIAVRTAPDVIEARREGRSLAEALGFGETDRAVIATAISELARNIVQYAGSGEIVLEDIAGPKTGLRIRANDHGPGIEDLKLAMRDGWSSGGGLGMGLPGTRRLMDDFEIESAPGAGTRITVTRWLR